MLGYVRTDTPELRIRDQHVYRSLYCGLCRRMGKCTGQCSRLSLSYDFVFLAALRMSLCGEKHEEKAGRCLLHPFKKRAFAVNSASLDYCADASAILTCQKCLDDVHDERGLRRLRGWLAYGLFRSAGKRAARRYPALQKTVTEKLAALQALENDPPADASADAPAKIFGELMGAVFAEGLDDKEARVARALGTAIGHWIYLADAADDLAKDEKKQRFNPLLHTFSHAPLTDEEKSTVRLAMLGQLTAAEQAFALVDRFPGSEYKEILCNILYLGLPKTTNRVLHLPSDKKETAK